MTELWCYIEGKHDIFSVSIPPNCTIDALRKQICDEQHIQLIAKCSPLDLTLVKVNVSYNEETQKQIEDGVYQPASRSRLNAMDTISDIWEQPPNRHIHLFVGLPGGVGSPTLVYVGNNTVDSGLVREYKDIFIKVKRWGVFEGSDIETNGLHIYLDATAPDFVAEFERNLDGKPGLAADAYHIHNGIRDAGFLNAYFGPIENGTVEDVSPEVGSEPRRLAGYHEVAHLAHIALGDWQLFWNGKLGKTLKEPAMNGIFFQSFSLVASQMPVGSTTTILTGKQPWPLHLITKCETISNEREQLRKFRPRNDPAVSKSNLPRLLVEVNSKPKTDRPEDLVRMLLTGAAVVRIANRFLGRFVATKNFVLCAMYVWESGEVTRYSLFQERNTQVVRWKETNYRLDTSVDRAQFVRQLYNLRDMLEREEETEDTAATMRELINKIEEHNRGPMKSFHTKDAPGTNNTRGNKRPRLSSDVDGRGAGATDCAELGAHGYDVEPQDFVYESGIVMESLFDMPPHILTVYQQSDPSRKFIAKKVREDSAELEIFKLLNTFQLKSEHIISLYESFQTQLTSWAILPKMISLADGQLYGKVAQACWGLIEGVAYLHKHCIAHRDIKPENLVVDWDSCLKIIDFDVAMKVNDENEVINGQCGTKGWMAPEMEEKSMYSPIKADWWSTGQVLLYLLNKFRKEDTVLRTTAEGLTAHNPERRSSILQVAASLSGAVNVAVKRKASRSLQDTVEVDGENTKPPRVKKQKLSVPDRMYLRQQPVACVQ